MSSGPARLAVPFAALALIALLALLSATPASAAKRSLRPASISKRTITFELRNLKPQAIRKATLYSSSGNRRIRRATVRRAASTGRLKVRRARRSSRTPRLIIITDSTRPRVRWRRLSQGESVSGVLNAKNGNCRVIATDNVSVRRVDFYRDGKHIGQDAKAPYTCRWDTRTAMNGAHKLSAVAADSAGRTKTAVVGLTVHGSSLSATARPGSGASKACPWVAPVPAAPAAPFEHLVFQDNFDGTSVNPASWNPYTSAGHAGNGLRRASAFSVANGLLAVTASWDGMNIVSGGMNHRSNYQYGRFEVRVRTENDPTAQTSGVVLTWPQSNHWIPDGENDIYETAHAATRNPFYSYIHYSTDGKTDCQYSKTHNVDGAQWHTMRMDWTPTSIKLYRDGVLTYTLTDAQAIRDVPHHLSIQLDAFSNRPPQGAVRMYVDWVKVYQ